MIVCTECGHRNDDADDFCGNCGSFLEFSGQPVVVPDEPEVVELEEELDEAHRPTIVERVKAAVGLGEGEPGDDVGADEVTDDGEAGVTVRGAGVHTAPTSVEEEAAAEARRTEQESQRRAEEAQRAAEDALRAAQEAEAAAEAEGRHAAEAEARREAEGEARLRAERAVADAQEQARAVAAAAEDAMAQQAEGQGRQTARAAGGQTEHTEAAERAAREAAETVARQRAEAEAREAAERAAREEATTARRQAEAQAKAAEAARGEADARRREAQQAVRMAALVAKARPTEEAAHPATPESTSAPSDTGLASDSRDRLAPTDSRTGARRPQPVHPQRPKPKRPKPTTAPDEVLNPGDLICGQCGTGNDPERRFCRRCGNSLIAAAVVLEPPWWRRVLRRKPKAKAEAGSRPHTAGATPRDLRSKGQYAVLKTKSTMAKLGRVAAVLAIVGIAGLSLGPWRDNVGDQIRKVKRLVVPEYDVVRPASAEATSALDGHPPAAAIDQISNSYWAEGSEGTGEGQGLTLTFEEPVDLDRVGFLNGASEQPQDFVTQPRLREVQLVFDDGTTKMITLNDDAKFQHHGVKARGVTKVQLQIVSVYPSLEGQAASLAEVEFRTKR